MQTINDVHLQFALFFKSRQLQPYAYLVSKKLSEGNICLNLAQLDGEVDELPTLFKHQTVNGDGLTEEQEVGKFGGEKKPFVLHNRNLYLERYFYYETMILERIRQSIQTEKALEVVRIQGLVQQSILIEKLFPSALGMINWSVAAAVTAVLRNFCIITGGPGTGKTTTVARILALLFSQNPDLSVALAAPTGKAAARMAESLKQASVAMDDGVAEQFRDLEPSTIHRLLKVIPDSPYFRHDRHNQLRYDVVIVDESSMIDVSLFAKLLDAVHPDSRIILLGDKDQLASVEAGSLFGDLCNSGTQVNGFNPTQTTLINSFIETKESQLPTLPRIQVTDHPLNGHIVELQYSHRFNSTEGIGKFSDAVIRNDVATIETFYKAPGDTRILMDTEYDESIFESFIAHYAAYIEEPDITRAFTKFKQLKVLCAVREGRYGVRMVNKKIEAYLTQKKLLVATTGFYEHCPIMITRNNHSLGLYNGDVGIVRKDTNGVMKVWFETSEGATRAVMPGLISHAETVFAMTIHKSQGSEFDQVMVILPGQLNSQILTRELLYTGVTRAKLRVVIQGSKEAVLSAAAKRVQRASGISERFSQGEEGSDGD